MTTVISRARAMWEAAWRVFVTTATLLAADAFRAALASENGFWDELRSGDWWLAILAPAAAAALRGALPQPVDRQGVGVEGVGHLRSNMPRTRYGD
jgi:hypothetical protein